MAKTSKTSIGVTITGDGETSTYVPVGNPFTNTTAPSGGTVRQALTTGNDTVLIPTGAIGVCIAPPDATLLTLRFKVIVGDTGHLLKLAHPAVMYFDPALASFLLISGAIGFVDLHWL